MKVLRSQFKNILLIFATLAAFITNAIQLNVMEDDAYISFRYLDNLLSGNGLVFNPGEHVEGYTNLLWILLMVPLRALGMSPEQLSVGLAIIAAAVLFAGVYLLTSRLTRDRNAGIAAVILTATFPPLAHYVTSGLETVLFAALLALAFARLAHAGKPDAWVAVLLGAAVMTRPEAMMTGLLIYGIYPLMDVDLGKRRFLPERGTRNSLLLFLLFPVLLTAWRLAYYGDPLPNTYYAKATGIGMELVGHGAKYMLQFALGLQGWLLLAAVVLVFIPALLRRVQDRALVAALGVSLLMHLLYVIKVGGDYLPMSRFMLHIFPLLTVLATLGIWLAARQRGMFVLAITTGIAVVQNFAFYSGPDYRMMTNLRGSIAAMQDTALAIRESFPPGTLLAVDIAGIIPYLTGFRTIDMLGLNDRHIARTQPSAKVGNVTGMIPGHFKYDGEYVCSLQPDVVVMLKALSVVATSPGEAAIVSALNSLDSDRAFLKACGDHYEPNVTLQPNGRYRVLYVKRKTTAGSGDADSAFERGLMLMGQARLAEARESFRESVRNHLHLEDAYTNIGYTFFDEGKLEEAKAAFEDALNRYPANSSALYGLALSVEKLGDKSLAVELWRRYLTSNADPKWKARAQKRLSNLGY